MQPKYKRILLKLSGEALAGDMGFGLDQPTINSISEQIKKIVDMGIEVSVVVGGGNIWRGRDGEGMDRVSADYMGMLATTINSIAIQESLERMGQPVRVQSAITMQEICEPYIRRRAVRHLEKGRVVVFAAGIGNPFFSTDTTAALRAAEMDAEVILSAKSVDGVYDSDPALNPEAKKYDELTYMEIVDNSLKVIDSSAAILCMENKIPIILFSLRDPENIVKAICGEKVGTLIR